MTKVCHKRSGKNEICRFDQHCAKDLACLPKEDKLLCLPKAKLGATCEYRTDCESNLQCRQKDLTDRQYTCLKEGKSGELCRDAVECEKGLECRATSREPNSPMTCRATSTKGGSCAYNSDCEKPYKCRGYRTQAKRYCSDRASDLGEYCSTWTDCEEFPGYSCPRSKPGAFATCQGGSTLGEFCEEDQHCPGEMKCNRGPQGNGICGSSRKRGEKCGENLHCPANLTCRAISPSKNNELRYCLEPLANGKLCYHDSNCKSEVCVKPSRNSSWVCQDPLPLGSVCDNWKHCASGLTCRKKKKDPIKQHCLPMFSAGEPCEGSKECKLNHRCRTNICERYGTEYGAFCSHTRECKGKLECLNKKCQMCRSNFDCPSDHFCEAFKCLRI